MISDPNIIELQNEFAGVNPQDWRPVALANPVEMLFLINQSINTAAITLHPWQKEILLFLAAPIYSQRDPLQFQLVAANGSGKDAFVIGPFAVWHALSKRRSKCYITSSSAAQLQTQTEPSIRSYCEAWNRLQPNTFKVRQRHISCLPTGSEIVLRVTDDPGRLEGEHPFSDFPDCEFCVIANEAKTIDDDMFAALERCSGFNRWIEVSTPGKTAGHLYTTWRRSTKYPEKYIPGKTVWWSRKISALECPHISRKVIDDKRLSHGENSAFYRSSVLAEFSELNEMVIITSSMIEKGQARDHEHISLTKSAGFDLSSGSNSSDECVGYFVDGNRILDWTHFTGVGDGVAVANRVCEHLAKWKLRGLDPKNCSIDDGGIGKIIIDIIRRSGFDVQRVHNQGAAYLKVEYGNLGAEMYYNVARFMEEGLINLDPREHSVLIDQLRSRLYRKGERDKTFLESKPDMKSRGLHSPDRADAYVLSMRRYRIQDFISPTQDKEDLSGSVFNPQTYEMSIFDKSRQSVPSTPTNGSMSSLFAQRQPRFKNYGILKY